MTSEPLKEGNNALTYYLKGLDSFSLCKNEEALSWFDRAIEINPNEAKYYYNKGLVLQCLHKDQDAVLCFDRAIEICPTEPLYYCVRGRTLRSLNKQKEALIDFKKAQENEKGGEARSEVEYLTIVVNSIFELQKNDEKTEKIMGQLDKNNLKSMKFVEDFKVLQITKEKVITDLLAGIEEKSYKEMLQEKTHAVSQLKGDYERLQKEMGEELSKEIDEFYSKLYAQVEDLNLGSEGRINVEQYLKAFRKAFRFAFGASQEIENESLQVDIGHLLGDTSRVDSIGNFFSREEIQRNAKKMLELFFDSSVYLNAVVGRAAGKIVLDQKKREHILSVTESEVEPQNRKLFEMLSNLCEPMNGAGHVTLFQAIQNIPAARLGRMDANDLIQECLEGKISAERIQEEFVERTLKRQRAINQVEAEEIKIKIKEKKESGKGKCCNIF